MPTNKNVHTEHCCAKHGCKYGEDATCPVVAGRSSQSYPCEHCDEDMPAGIANVILSWPDVKTMTREALESELVLLRQTVVRADRRLDEFKAHLDQIVVTLNSKLSPGASDASVHSGGGAIRKAD